MSKSHIKKLIYKLECAKWKIITEYFEEKYIDYEEIIDYTEEGFKDFWMICRPNGDSIIKLNFMIGGNGIYGDNVGNETICDAISCTIEDYPHIDLYFGKYSKRFQKDLNIFIEQLNKI